MNSLTPAADLIRKPGAWTQRCEARNRHNIIVAPHSSEAVCFCAEGAIDRAYGPNRHIYRSIILERLPKASTIWAWNDAPERTQAEVVAALEAVELQINEVRK